MYEDGARAAEAVSARSVEAVGARTAACVIPAGTIVRTQGRALAREVCVPILASRTNTPDPIHGEEPGCACADPRSARTCGAY
jgi:hypothetical protein